MNEKTRLKGSDEILSSLVGKPSQREEAKGQMETAAPASRRRGVSRAAGALPEPADDRNPLDFGRYKLPDTASAKAAESMPPAPPPEPEADDIPLSIATPQELQQQVAAMIQPERQLPKRRGRPRKKEEPEEQAQDSVDVPETSPREAAAVKADSPPEPPVEEAPAFPVIPAASAQIIPDNAVKEYSFEDFSPEPTEEERREEERRRQAEEKRLARRAAAEQKRREQEAAEQERRRKEEKERLAREAAAEKRRKRREEERLRKLAEEEKERLAREAEEERRRLMKEEELRSTLMTDERSLDEFMQRLSTEFESKFAEKYSEPLRSREEEKPPEPKSETETEPPMAEEPEAGPLDPVRDNPEERTEPAAVASSRPAGPEEPGGPEGGEQPAPWFERVEPKGTAEDAPDPDAEWETSQFLEQFAEETRREEEITAASFKDTLADKFMRERERYMRELANNLEREEEREQEPAGPEPAGEEVAPVHSQRRRLDFRIQPEMHQPEGLSASKPLTYKPDATVRYQEEEPELPPEEPPKPEKPPEPIPKTAEERLMELARGLPDTPRTRRQPPEKAARRPLPVPASPKAEPSPKQPRRRGWLIARMVIAAVIITAAGFAVMNLWLRYRDAVAPQQSEAPVAAPADEPYKVYESRSATEREVHSDVMIMRPGVTLNNFHVTNYLIVEDVPDAGAIQLENMTVDGAIYLRSSAIHLLELRDVRAARIIVNNSQNPVEIRIAGATDVGTVEVKSSATLTQAVEDTALGFQNVTTESADTPLDLKLSGLDLQTLSTTGGNMVNFLSTNVQSMTSDGALSLYGDGRVTNLALSDPEALNVLVKDVAVSNISAKSPGSVNVSTAVDTMALENPTSLGGSGSIGSLTLNPKHESTRMTVDIAGLNVQVLTANAECLLDCTGSAQLNTVVANASTNLTGNKVNLLQVNDDFVLYENMPDRIETAPGVRPPQAAADNPNTDETLPVSQQAELPTDVSGDQISTLCGHPRESGGFTVGDGSVDNPYEISTAEQLAHITQHAASHYVQAANIDIADNSRYADSFEMICGEDTAFSGSYDGAGYTISNLRIASVKESVGLFAENIGTIRNVAIVSGEIASTSTPRAYVGGIVGQNYGNGVVEGCSNGARVTGRSDAFAGGIAGYNFGGKVLDSYNTAKISGGSYSGGLVGVNLQDATLARSYNVGLVETGGTAGAVVGSNENAIVTNCYFLQETAETGIGSGDGTVFSRTNEEMSAAQTVADLSAGAENTPWVAGNDSYQFPRLALPQQNNE